MKTLYKTITRDVQFFIVVLLTVPDMLLWSIYFSQFLLYYILSAFIKRWTFFNIYVYPYYCCL